MVGGTWPGLVRNRTIDDEERITIEEEGGVSE